MVDAIVSEIDLQIAYLNDETVETIYFGGGTPSLLSKTDLKRIIAKIRSSYSLSESPEITLEANPDDLTEDYLGELVHTDVNRLSIGIQSFNDKVLKWMNRAHDGQQALNSISMARDFGFDNFSLDLIFGVPYSSYNLNSDLKTAIDHSPPHISTYNLTIEPKTVFGKQHDLGQLIEVPEETAAEQYEYLMASLIDKGYSHYEISNFAIPGKESHHNRNYWRQEPYLGIGPSAHSFDGHSRQYNVANNQKYLKALSENIVPLEIEVLNTSQKINEAIMMGLRTSQGLDVQALKDDLEWDLLAKNAGYLKQLMDGEFAYIKKNKLILNTKGKLVADRIASDLFVAYD